MTKIDYTLLHTNHHLMNLTITRLEKAIIESVKDMKFLEQRDIQNILNSIKVGEDAEYHTGSRGCLGYFCTEETAIPMMVAEGMEQALEFTFTMGDLLGGMCVEPINSCEYGIYQ